MEQQPVDLKKLSVIELKALAYDFITDRDRLNSNIAMINQELSIKLTAAAADDKKDQ